MQQNLTGEQKNEIKYWSAGAVLRWNEIMRELVAKHNLPPYQNEDGTYPIPSSVNPFNYPQFPFSNPPYAARAYAYVSAAQYDALIACWYYKKLYNRPAPYKVDSTINANTFIAKNRFAFLSFRSGGSCRCYCRNDESIISYRSCLCRAKAAGSGGMQPLLQAQTCVVILLQEKHWEDK